MPFEKVDGVSKQNRIVDFYLHRPSLKVQIQAGRLKWSDALRCHHYSREVCFQLSKHILPALKDDWSSLVHLADLS